MSEVIALILGYALGSISFGLVVTKTMGLENLRSVGSGNIGATNVLRTGSKAAAAATLIGDMGKGVVAVLLARYFWGETAALIAGFGAFVGHLFPIWIGFKGGKGVATFLGIVLAVSFLSGVVACATWLITAFFGRISSLSALCASIVSPIFLTQLHSPAAGLVGICISILIWVRHHENIARLLAGKESRIGSKG